jgi:hypothetical protein
MAIDLTSFWPGCRAHVSQRVIGPYLSYLPISYLPTVHWRLIPPQAAQTTASLCLFVARLPLSQAMGARPGSCHNCRRGRLKCDRSIPQCLKCTSRGQSCLGYGVLLRWEKGMASRGKLVGVTSDSMSKIQNGDTTATIKAPRARVLSTRLPPLTSSESSSPRSLTDPLVQDLDWTSRRYLNYCRVLPPAWLIHTNILC